MGGTPPRVGSYQRLFAVMVSPIQRERKTIPLHPMRTMALRARQKASLKPLQLSVLLSTVDMLLTVRTKKARANVPKPPKGKLRTNEFKSTLRKTVLRLRRVRARRPRRPKLPNLKILSFVNKDSAWITRRKLSEGQPEPESVNRNPWVTLGLFACSISGW